MFFVLPKFYFTRVEYTRQSKRLICHSAFKWLFSI